MILTYLQNVMKTWKELEIGLSDGKWFLIQIANKQAEEVIISQWCIIGLPGALFKPEFEKMKKSPL